MQILKYLVSGVFNTAVGYGVFWILYTFFGVTPLLANAFGYAIALIVAFLLNKFFVFDAAKMRRNTIPKFIAAFMIAFLANQLALLSLYKGMSINAEIAQLLAMMLYTVLFYLLNKYLVFR